MRIVDRYISSSIIIIFLTTIFVFSFLYILIDAANNLDDIIKSKVSFSILIQYYTSFLPVIVVQMSSIACLISIIFTFGRLNHNNEVIVLRTCGLNFWKITKSAIFFGLVVSAFMFWLNERFVPQALVSSNEIKSENVILKLEDKQRKQPKISNLTFYGLKNRLYFVDVFDPNNYELERITVLGQDNDQNMKEKIVALKGKWTGIAWKFYQCHITSLTTAGTNTTEDLKYYDEKLMDIKETPQDFLKQRLDVTAMNIRQLYDYIVRFSGSGATKALNNLRVDMHQKIALPFGNIAIILLGLPLSLMAMTRKAVNFTSLGIAIGVGFLFHVLNALGLALGKGGLLTPVVSAWIAPFIFCCASFYLIKTKF